MLSKDELSQKIKEIVRDQLSDKDTFIGVESRLSKDLELDELDKIEIVMVIEGELDIRINDDDLGLLDNVEFADEFCMQNLIDAVAKQVNLKD